MDVGRLPDFISPGRHIISPAFGWCPWCGPIIRSRQRRCLESMNGCLQIGHASGVMVQSKARVSEELASSLLGLRPDGEPLGYRETNREASGKEFNPVGMSCL